jgi:hypothetical protein
MRLCGVRFSGGPQNLAAARAASFRCSTRVVRAVVARLISVRIGAPKPTGRGENGRPSSPRSCRHHDMRVRVAPAGPTRVRPTVGQLIVNQSRGAHRGFDSLTRDQTLRSRPAVGQRPHKPSRRGFDSRLRNHIGVAKWYRAPLGRERTPVQSRPPIPTLVSSPSVGEHAYRRRKGPGARGHRRVRNGRLAVLRPPWAQARARSNRASPTNAPLRSGCVSSSEGDARRFESSRGDQFGIFYQARCLALNQARRVRVVLPKQMPA